MKRSPAGITLMAIAAMGAGCTHSGQRTTSGAYSAAESRPGSSAAMQWSFDDLAPGKLPPHWVVAETRPTRDLARWEVAVDPAAASGRQVLSLLETNSESPTFNLAIANDTSFKDLELSVRVKAVRGEIDQGGGPIWRCKDANNYYIARINPLENNYRVYKVVGGQRKELGSVNTMLEAGRWYTLGVTMRGSRIECTLDGKRRLIADDRALPDAGRIGLWTKADAATSFDDLHVRAFDQVASTPH